MFSFIPKSNRFFRPSLEKVEPQRKISAIGAVEFQPSAQIFENFGICGNCEVACREGLAQLKNLKLHDIVITRSHGLVSPVCMMMNSSDAGTEEKPRAGVVLSGSLGNNLPQGDIAIGANSTFISYQQSETAPRLKPVANGPSSRKGMNILIDCPVEALCVPVFKKRVEILVHGIYVLCPSLTDVSIPKFTRKTKEIGSTLATG
ncbi:MAG: hypothetical protein ABJH20_01560 [Rhizobiaceae bacterium]